VAEVWRATLEGPHGFQRQVVLKRVRRDRAAEPRALAQLLDEARLSAKLSHANVAQVYEVVEAEGDVAVAMEWIDGVDVGRVFAARRAGSSGLAAFVVSELARALAHAHERPIVHRDVSPANVMLGRNGSVKLVDFGIARLLDELVEPATRTASLKGSLAYMAPEQLARRAAGPAADVYAAGVLLYELSTGKRLFTALYELSELAAARACPIAPPSTLGADPALDEICARCLAVDPEARFADGAALYRALAPVSARLEWGSAQLAGLVADLLEAEADARLPERHTVSVVAPAPVDAAPTVVDPPRRSRRGALAIGAVLLVVVAAALGWRALRARVESPSLALPPLVAAPPPPAEPVVPASVPAKNPPAKVEPVVPASVPAKNAKKKPSGHLVDGKLLDPFHR